MTPSVNRRTLGIVFFTVFLDLVGFGLIIPIQPFFAETLGASPAVVTLLGASFSLMQFIFAPLWGRLSDKIGRRPVLLISIAITAVGYLLFGFAQTLGALFFARMLAGIGSGNIGTAQAIIADSTAPEARAKGMGLVGAAFGLGFIFGPALGGALGQFGLSAPAFAAAALGALNWIFAFGMLPETYPKAAREAGLGVKRSHGALTFAALKHAARHVNVGQIFLLYLLYTTAFSTMEQVLGLFIERHWIQRVVSETSGNHARRAAALTAWVLIMVGVTATIVQGGLIGRLAKRFGERRLLITGCLMVGLSFFFVPLVGWSGIFGLMLVNAVLMAAGTGIINPSLSSLLSRSVDRDEQGGVLGLGQSLAALGRVIGPSVSGTLFQIGPPIPFLTGAVLLVGCSAVAFSLTSVDGKPQPLGTSPAMSS